MNFDKLNIFYMVASVGSPEEAAKKLNCTTAHVTRYITSFELELKCALFNRKDKKWKLTPQGQILARKARGILSEVESTRHLISDDSNNPSGLLKIVMTKNLTALWISQFLKDFTDEYADIRLHVSSNDNEVDVVLGEADVMIRPMVAQSDDIIQEYLMTWHVGLYASPEYLGRFGVPETVQDLDNHRLISLNFNQNLPYQYYWYLTLGKTNNEARAPFISIDSGPAVIDCVLQGIGIAPLSAELPIIKHGRLVRVLPDVMGPQVDIYYIYPRALFKSPRIRLFGDYLRERAATPMLQRPRVFS